MYELSYNDPFAFLDTKYSYGTQAKKIFLPWFILPNLVRTCISNCGHYFWILDPDIICVGCGYAFPLATVLVQSFAEVGADKQQLSCLPLVAYERWSLSTSVNDMSTRCELEVNRRLGRAWSAMNSLDVGLCRCRYLCKRTKVRVFRSLVLNVSAMLMSVDYCRLQPSGAQHHVYWSLIGYLVKWSILIDRYCKDRCEGPILEFRVAFMRSILFVTWGKYGFKFKLKL